MTSPPFHLRRLALIWSPLLVACGLFIALAPFHAGLWALIPLTLTAWAITAELTETKETTT